MKLGKFFRKWARPDQKERRFDLHLDLLAPLETLATYRGSTAQAVAAELVEQALLMEQLQKETWEKWQSLTPREQEVTALICCGYTGRVICARLGIANETVRSHVHNILRKLEVTNRKEIRQLLSDWDFSAWK